MVGRIEFNRIFLLLQLQNQCISQLYQHIDALTADLYVSTKLEFKAFLTHFKLFIQNHARSEGFCTALETVQVYNQSLLDKLLNSIVLIAAEELELSIVYLEILAGQSSGRTDPKIILLNQKMSTLEETQLQIIEFLEELLLNFTGKYLEN